MLTTVGFRIVNACTIVALHQRSGTTFLEEAAPEICSYVASFEYFYSRSSPTHPAWSIFKQSSGIPESKSSLPKCGQFVLLYVALGNFTERAPHMHRLQTQMPSVFFQRWSKDVPEKTSFKPLVDAFSGVRFFSHFFGFLCYFWDSARKHPKGANCPAGLI